MPDLASLIQHGATNLWLFIPTAIMLGALHGLEPGHSKTMMAAFIIAIRGTVAQAVLLGLSATISHTLIVWLVALAGLHFGAEWGGEATEPYFQMISAALMLIIALWMIARTWQHTHAHHHHDHDDHHHPHDHDHDHGHTHHHGCCHTHPDAADEEDHTTPVPHYHPPQEDALDLKPHTGADAHAMAHAAQIQQRFANRPITTTQIVLFGLTGGLIPCPASITVLLLCLQLGKVSLGALLVLCFSIGLALTMVSAGVIAALSARHVGKRWSGFSRFAERAPYFSGGVIALLALYLGLHGLMRIL